MKPYHKQQEQFRKRREKVRALFESGVPAQKIADQLKITRQRVYQLLGTA
jgi:DNA invertase Pin-like site-specific DNA recombinase